MCNVLLYYVCVCVCIYIYIYCRNKKGNRAHKKEKEEITKRKEDIWSLGGARGLGFRV